MTIKRKFTVLILVLVIIMTSFCWNIETADAAAEWYWPFDGYTSQAAAFGKISSSYGYRGKGYNRVHYGVDIAEPRGKNVYAVRSGRVITVHNSTSGTAGRYIVIDHLDGYYSTYMHLSAVYVSSGANVTQNTAIGAVGGSANGSETAYGAHLHLRISYGAANNESSINPCPPGYTRVGASFNDGVGYPMGQATISYKISRSATPTACTHTYVTESETAHPHKEYKRCTKCGYTYYTGVNFAGKINSCSLCQAMSTTPTKPGKPEIKDIFVSGNQVVVTWNRVANAQKYDVYLVQAPWRWEDIKYHEAVSSNQSSCTFKAVEKGMYRAFIIARPNDNATQSKWVPIEITNCNHNYMVGYESAHPHKQYRLCQDCGHKEYTGKTVKNAACQQCNGNKTFYITIDPNGGNIEKGNYSYTFTTGQFIDLSQISLSKAGYKFTGWRLKLSDENKWCTNKSDNYAGYYFSTPQEISEKGYKYRNLGGTGETTISFSRSAWVGDKSEFKLTLVANWEKDPSAESECQHDYEKKIETSHPHEIYYQCSKCGDRFGTNEYAIVDGCDQCVDEEEKVEAVYVVGKANNNSVNLNWSGQDVTAEYVIYRSADGINYEEYDETFDTSYIDENVEPGNTYYYYIIVEGKVNTSEQSNICKVKLPSQSTAEKIRTSIEKTQIKKLKAKRTGSKIKLTWSKTAAKYKVDGYFVLRSTKKNGTYKMVKSTSNKSCTITKPKKGKKVYYMVFGYRTVNGETIHTVPAIIEVKG